MYVEVAVNRLVRQTFHYHIPSELISLLQPGHLVEVEFGTARMSAIVLACHENSPVPHTKPVLKLLDKIPVVTPLQLELAQWMAETTLAPIGLCLWLMLPPGLTSESTYRYELINHDDPGNTENQRRLISLLKRRGVLTTGQLQRALPQKNWQSAMRQLVQRETVAQEMLLRQPSVQPKIVRSARLAIPPSAVPQIAVILGRESKRANILEVLWVVAGNRIPLAELMEIVDNPDSSLKTLRKDGHIQITPDDVVELLLPAEQVASRIIELRGGQMYLNILEVLAEVDEPVSASAIYKQTGANLAHLKRLAEDGLIVLGESEVWRDPLTDVSVMSDVPPPLTHPQQDVWGVIQAYIRGVRWGDASPDPASSHVFLVHGVTGSGKTEIYLRAVGEVLGQGRQAVVMVPEIALTAQLVQRFMARFPKRVAIIHSSLTPGERYDTWRRIRNGEIDVVVGARSALFVPLPTVGLIILDEEHDDSYKQSPGIPPPYYHARDVAIAAMRINRGTVILGSATPNVTSMFHARRGDFVLLRLPDRVLASRDKIQAQIELLNLPSARYLPTEVEDAVSIELPPVQVVDMRQELRAGNRSIFSRELQNALRSVLAHKQQAILFLNRRGTATFVMCRDCGYIAKCERCETPLTYHAPHEALICHYCGNRQDELTSCPECKSVRIKYFGTGTEKIDTTLHELFPQARILRWDQDTAKERGAHARILGQFLRQEADILVGTQMIAKGLDIPLVTLVGIVSGDTSIGLPDYRVGERTFQLLTQVAGRAGRGVLGGRVILQTYHPDHYAIQAAAEHDFYRFYEKEITYRAETRYPPFARLARLLFVNRNQAEAKQEAERLYAVLQERKRTGNFTVAEIIGPIPCFFMRLDNYFRWQILVRSLDPVALLRGVDIGSHAMLDIDPVDLL